MRLFSKKNRKQKDGDAKNEMTNKFTSTELSSLSERMIQIFDSGKMEPKTEAEIWYVVEAEFIRFLRRLKSDLASGQLLNNDPHLVESSKKPFFIRNDNLLSNADKESDMCDDCIEATLSSKYILGKDFQVVEESVWNTLMQYSTADTCIARKCFRNNEGNIKVEIQPMSISVLLTTSEIEADTVLTHVNLKVSVSVSRPFKFLIEKLKNCFPEAREFMVGLPVGPNKYSLWKKLKISDIRDTVSICQMDFDSSTVICCSKEKCVSVPDYSRSFFSGSEKDIAKEVPLVDLTSNKEVKKTNETSPVRVRSLECVGLVNLGNTCFLNSALQCLIRVIPLTHFFLSKQFLQDLNSDNPLGFLGKLAMAYHNFLKEMFLKCLPNSFFAPQELKRVIGRCFEQFQGYNQQDSQELLAFLLDGLHEDLNRVKKKIVFERVEGTDNDDDAETAVKSWNSHKSRNDSIVVDIFQGQYRSRLECPSCKKHTVGFDPYMFLSVSIEQTCKVKVLLMIGPPGCPPAEIHLKLPSFLTLPEVKKAIRLSLLELQKEHYDFIPTLSDALIYSLKAASVILEVHGADENARYSFVSNMISDNNMILAKLETRCFGRLIEKERKCYSVLSVLRSSKYGISVARNSELRVWILPQWMVALYEKQLNDEQMQLTPSQFEKYNLKNGILQSNLKICNVMPTSSSVFISKNDIMETQLSDIRCICFSTAKNKNYCESWMGLAAVSKTKTKIIDLYNYMQDLRKDFLEFENAENYTTNNYMKDSKLYSTRFLNKREDVENNVPESKWIILGNFFFIDAKTGKHIRFPNETEGAGDMDLCSFFNDLRIGEIDDIPLIFSLDKFLSPPCLEIPTRSQSGLHLNDCIETYQKEEILDDENAWFCSHCKLHVRAKKKIDLWTVPPVLIVHLKRFSKTCEIRKKIHTVVDFPYKNNEYLDIKPYLSDSAMKYNLNREPGFDGLYELFGIIGHCGELGQGHYDANVKVGGQWFICDNTTAKKISIEQLNVPGAYLLFYQQKQLFERKWSYMLTT